MEYKPSLPAHNDNASPESPLRDVVAVVLGLLAAAALAYWLLGLAVDATVLRMSTETEARLYALLPAPGPDKTPVLPQQAQLQELVNSLHACAGLRLPTSVTLEKSQVPNAMVVPGGHIVVYSGLLSQVRSENGLAFVLAHELAHISQRDHLRAVGRSLVLFGFSALLTGSDSGLTELLAPVDQLGQASYSRTREAAADAVALRILNCRYGHAGGATEFFSSMKDEDSGIADLSHYTSSHPAMQQRIDTLNRAIRQAGYKEAAVAPLRIQVPE